MLTCAYRKVEMRTRHSISKPANTMSVRILTSLDAFDIANIGSHSRQHRSGERTDDTVGCAWDRFSLRRRGYAVVAVVQSADFWNGDNASCG